MKQDGTDFPTSDDSRQTADMAWRSVSYLTAGLLFYGGIGWLLGKWLGHQEVFIAIGLIVGIVLALYLTYARVAAMGRANDHDDRRNTPQ